MTITRTEAIDYVKAQMSVSLGYHTVTIGDVVGPYKIDPDFEDTDIACDVEVLAKSVHGVVCGAWTVWRMSDGTVYGEW